MVWLPPPRDDVEKCAVPPLRLTVPMRRVPLKNVTEPVGVPDVSEATCAVNVTLCVKVEDSVGTEGGGRSRLHARAGQCAEGKGRRSVVEDDDKSCPSPQRLGVNETPSKQSSPVAGSRTCNHRK